MSSWDFKANRLYGRLPQVALGDRLTLSATMDRSTQLTPGFYEMFAITGSGTTWYAWVKDGVSTVTAATTDFYIPASTTYVFEVKAGVNDYVAAISRGGRNATLLICRKQDVFSRN